jgi:predicted HTH transcriptional regulator
MKLSEPELVELIAGGEGKTLEFKRGLPRDEKTARSLVAFANTRGGILLIGVGDRGELIGAPRPKQTLEHLREIAEFAIEPPLAVETQLVVVDGRKIVCCSVPLSPKRPHAVLRADGEPEIVVRAGSSNRATDGPTLRALRGQSNAKKLDDLDRRILAWVDTRARKTVNPGGDATLAGFIEEFNIGTQRARRAFINLERSGQLIAHGVGKNRVYSRP